MANPYHDEEGEFTSRERMSTRVTELHDAGETEKAIKLHAALRTIDAEKERAAALTELAQAAEAQAAKKKQTVAPRPLNAEPDDDDFAYHFVHLDEDGEVSEGDVITYEELKQVLDSMTDEELTQFARGDSDGEAAFIRSCEANYMLNPPSDAVDLSTDPEIEIRDLDAYYARRGLVIP